MKKVIIFLTVVFLAIVCTGCGSNAFNSAKSDFKSFYLEVTKGTLVLGQEDKVETSEISKIFNEEDRKEKIAELKIIVSDMGDNAKSKNQKKILQDYQDYYEALVQIQSYNTPDSECTEEETFQRLACKMLITMGMREAIR